MGDLVPIYLVILAFFLYCWSYCVGRSSYLQASFELHRTYFSEIHCPHHLHGSGLCLDVFLVPCSTTEFNLFQFHLGRL
ncbi:hypothetical protein CXB51_008245 [Gossypium anomalum]|uniref:Uncharacterized protein n=1 Tax=Gossypium anomalum TaxID=47600 RepID=A0A8J6D7X5_9ROSI|nr:hypothetical protein CXB51_008245 [Gossypium anomalum]